MTPGNEIASGKMPKSWVRNVDGSVTNAQFDGKDFDKLLTKARGHTLIHNHPNHNPFSPHDLATASQFGVKEMIVVAPGYSFMLRPPKTGWHTPEFVEPFRPDARPRHGGAEGVGRCLRERAERHARGSPVVDGRRAELTPRVCPLPPTATCCSGTLLEGVAQQHAIDNMAKAYGWTYQSVVDHRIGVSATEVFNALEDCPHRRSPSTCVRPIRRP